MDQEDLQESLDDLGSPAALGPRDNQDPRARLELSADLDLRDRGVRLVNGASLDPQEALVHLADQDLQDHQVGLF